jgi:hypothetical protein
MNDDCPVSAKYELLLDLSRDELGISGSTQIYH